jgi:hypothetical protein
MFVFYTGLHIDKDHFLGEHASRQFWIIAFTSLLMPLLLGCLAGWIFIDYLYGDHLIGKGSRATYILSLGISTGVTALPVLSAILLEVASAYHTPSITNHPFQPPNQQPTLITEIFYRLARSTPISASS